jgi:molybdopterin-guanine dinucleotide biosynthesis protein A
MVVALNGLRLVDYDKVRSRLSVGQKSRMLAGDLITSIVLAGGKGTRLGKDKLLEVVGGRPLLQRVVDCLSPISERILVVTAQGQERPSLQATRIEVVTVPDIYPGKGALGGIYTGVSAMDTRHGLVVAADMPFLNPELLRHLVSVATDFDVVMPRISGQIEPLHAVYSKDCLPAIQEQIKRNHLQIRILLEQVRVKYVEEAEIDIFDPRHLSFYNVNTPDDLTKAQEIAAEIESLGRAGQR